MKDSGEILELKGPKLVGDVLSTFPGYDIFARGGNSSPLIDQEQLVNGQFYYLIPSRVEKLIESSGALKLVASLANGSGLEVLPSPRNGVWRVKLVINPRKLEEILSEEGNIEALIEQMSLAAACSAKDKSKQKQRDWGLNWRPCITNVCKLPSENNKMQSLSTPR